MNSYSKKIIKSFLVQSNPFLNFKLTNNSNCYLLNSSYYCSGISKYSTHSWPQINYYAENSFNTHSHHKIYKKTQLLKLPHLSSNYSTTSSNSNLQSKEVLKNKSGPLNTLGNETNVGKVIKKPGGKLRRLLVEYGLPFAFYYSSLYVGGGVGIYLIIESGLFGEMDIVELIKKSGIDNYYELSSRINPKYGNIGAAILLNEVLEIGRFPFAVLTIPYIKAAWDRRKNKSTKIKPS